MFRGWAKTTFALGIMSAKMLHPGLSNLIKTLEGGSQLCAFESTDFAVVWSSEEAVLGVSISLVAENQPSNAG